jgi:hypothetical protein
MAGILRTAIENMIRENINPSGGPGYFDRVKARFSEMQDMFGQAMSNIMVWTSPAFPITLLAAANYVVTGFIPARQYVNAALMLGVQPDYSKELADLIRQFSQNGTFREIAETMGVLAIDPMLNFFEQYAGKENIDPKEMLRSMAGVSNTFTAIGGLAGFAAETLSAGQIEAVSSIFDQLAQNSGLGYLNQRGLMTLFQYGLDPGLDTYYKKLFRPNRFSASDLRDLYALGKITPAAMREAAQTLGWKDSDVELWIQLAFRTLPQGDIFDAFHKGLMTQEQAAQRLRALGYDPVDLPLLFQLNPQTDTNQDKDISAATAKQAFRESLISEGELRSYLDALKYSPQEISLIVALETSKRETDKRSLSVGQVKSAWEENVITENEVYHWLTQDGMPRDQITILLDTWKAESAPTFRKLNSGTILEAYIFGVISRGATKDKLLSIGFDPNDADLEIRLAEVRNPEAFGQLPPTQARKLSPGTLAELVSLNLITPAAMSQRLKDSGYSAEDAALLSEAARLRTLPAARELSQGVILGAYLSGVIDHTRTDRAYPGYPGGAKPRGLWKPARSARQIAWIG